MKKYCDNTNIRATIQLDKLVFNCDSTITNNFHTKISESVYLELTIDNTTLKRSRDKTNRYEHSYNVFYKNIEIGCIDFDMYSNHSDSIHFSISNEVFYNGALKYVPNILRDLHLEIKNYTQIDIAIDSYNFDFERFLYRNIHSKENTLVILHKTIRDKGETMPHIVHLYKGSQINPYKARTIYIKALKRDTILLCAYNKKEELKESGKDYISDYHKKFNPKLNNLYRLEIRLKRNVISRLPKKDKISWNNLMNPSYLHDLMLKLLDRLIVCYKGKSKRQNKISVIPTDLQYCNM